MFAEIHPEPGRGRGRAAPTNRMEGARTGQSQSPPARRGGAVAEGASPLPWGADPAPDAASADRGPPLIRAKAEPHVGFCKNVYNFDFPLI